jgi:hypothetical protein
MTLITASVAFACGEILPVILISALFSLVQLNAKPVGGNLPRDSSIRVMTTPPPDRSS